jgi:hypothetical protein
MARAVCIASAGRSLGFEIIHGSEEVEFTSFLAEKAFFVADLLLRHCC